ncbi:MAG: hypothetical protein ABT05_04720 [Lautropia sp. SCN 66-9]|nr:MAG: hypothetical protein ABT05_04720 [Lautropia sp. SCN 66-9]
MQPWRGPAGVTSVWLEEALATEPDPAVNPLQGSLRADVCIVGGGYTALWTALRLKEQAPGCDVAIVEAGLCGSGASGRNSGAMGHWWARLPTLERLLGRHDAITVLQASVDILAQASRFIREHGIECDLRTEASVWSTSFRDQAGAWLPMLRAAERLGVTPPHRLLSKDELRAWFGNGPYYAGIVEDHAIRLQPAALARGLRRLAVQRGVRVFEESPVQRISADADAVTVRTAQGDVRAREVILAANAWMAHLPQFKPFIAVTSSEIVTTAPIRALLEQRGLWGRPGGVNSRLMLNYGGTTPQGRVYMGRGGGSIAWANRIAPRFDHNARMIREVERDFRYLNPELDDVPLVRGWAGPIDRCATGLPWFGRLAEDPRVHYGIGYSGHGVGATALGGQILASQVLGLQDEWTALGGLLARARSGWYPPEPIRFAAAHAIRAAVARKDEALRRGSAPSRLDNRLAALALSSLPDTWRSPFGSADHLQPTRKPN